MDLPSALLRGARSDAAPRGGEFLTELLRRKDPKKFDSEENIGPFPLPQETRLRSLARAAPLPLRAMLRINSLLDGQQSQQPRTTVDWFSFAEHGNVEHEFGAWLELHRERDVVQHETEELHSVYISACEQEGVYDHITPPRKHASA